MTAPHTSSSATRFPVAVDAALRGAGWRPGRWEIRDAEMWADTLRAHTSPAGHRHVVFPAAVEAWAEFGGLQITPGGPGRDVAPSGLHIDPLHGLYAARTLAALGRALESEVAPLGAEVPPDGDPDDAAGLLVLDADGRVYCLDPLGDWYLGGNVDAALTTLITGLPPARLTAA
ncbi:SUKH-3 domain-containing protein [Streptomyces sp. TR06-5]|uniref:SUKH-3 domain-containing protein n=1 Tax=unclassified Streptomyces TaxID=2593676 RepID=UPI0039A33929